jgi:hypothetical protein
MVRDTKQHAHGHIHNFTTTQWRTFIADIKADKP